MTTKEPTELARAYRVKLDLNAEQLLRRALVFSRRAERPNQIWQANYPSRRED